MHISAMMGRKSLALLAFALLCGCGGAPAVVAGTSLAQSQAVTKSDLLYVSDRVAGGVRFFKFPNGTLAGTLNGGLSRPEGICTDEAGHVWVGTYGDLFEYNRGQESPIFELKGLRHAVSECSVDPTTGNLAAVTYGSANTENAVFVFTGGRGKPAVYKNSAFSNYYSCAYDSHGNLYVSGRLLRHHLNNLLAVLPAGGSTLQTIKLKHTFPGHPAIQWDGQYVAILDADRLYEFAIEGSVGKQVGSATLTDSRHAKQFAIYTAPSTAHQRMLIAPLYQASGEVLYWTYPGGASAGQLPYSGFDDPYGVAISVAASRSLQAAGK